MNNDKQFLKQRNNDRFHFLKEYLQLFTYIYRVSAYLFFKYFLCYRLIFSISTVHLIYWSVELVLHDFSLVFIRHPSYIANNFNHISVKQEIMFVKWKRSSLSFSRLKLKAIIRIVFFQMKRWYQSSPLHCISIHYWNLFGALKRTEFNHLCTVYVRYHWKKERLKSNFLRTW